MSPKSKRVAVRASGGVVVRGAGPTAEVVLVHRPRYRDWTLPKGKNDPGETTEDAALREVWEETGLGCRIIAEAGTARYSVSAGPKEVCYLAMRPYRSSIFVPNHEVDEIRWMGLKEATKRLDYDFDRDLLAALDLGAVTAHSDLHLVRHAAAGDRATWDGPDEERPLTAKGKTQAQGVADGLADVGIDRILSSPYKRCVQTVKPLAKRLGLKVEKHPALKEGASSKAIASLLDEVAGSTAVLCSHGDVIPEMLALLQNRGVRSLSPFACQKGSTWSIAHNGSGFIEARYTPPADG